MTQGFNTTAMPVIVDGITNSNSAFGATEEGEAVFFNTRIVQRMNLEEGQMVYAHCIPNYEDKRDQIPWRCIRVEEGMDSDAVEGYLHAMDREDRHDKKHDTAIVKKFFEDNDEVWTLEEIASETKLSEDTVESVLELRPDLFKEVTAYVLVS
tara:strand:- start:58 stop:516 length:459 start_codon:yes stop_codon:yes gene_type:complete